jgi:FtsP/CotA-like multicopper oxidase with cupredoxin domain
MLSRRAVIMGALAASASLRAIAQAQNPPAGGPGGDTAPRTIFRLQRRTIEVNGKPASVYGIRQPDGTFGLTTDVGKPFCVRVENQIDEPSLIHWHG